MSSTRISNEIQNLNAKDRRRTGSAITEANVEALGSEAGKWKIKLRDGSIISEVVGPLYLTVGQSVTVAVHPGTVHKYIIVGPGYGNTGDITEAWV